MNRNETADVLEMFVAAWPQMQPTTRAAELWAEMLEDVETTEGLAAAKRLIRTRKYPPSIAEFLDEAVDSNAWMKRTATMEELGL